MSEKELTVNQKRITSIQWKRDNIADIRAFMAPNEPLYTIGVPNIGVLTVDGIETAAPGDWITKRSEGSFRVDAKDAAPRIGDVVRFSPLADFSGQLLGRVEQLNREAGRCFVNTNTAGKPQAMSFRGWIDLDGLTLGCAICGFFDGEHDADCPYIFDQYGVNQ